MSLILDGTNGLSDVDGSAATPAIRGTDANTGIFFPAADTIAFSEGGAEVMRIDSSGNLGLGVTPSAWDSVWKATQIGSTGFIAGRTNAERFYAGSNAYFNGTNWIYVTTGRATYYASNLSQHEWYYAGSGTAGNAITFTQAMTLDSSGNLLVGTTTSGGSDGGFEYRATSENGGFVLVRKNSSSVNGDLLVLFSRAGVTRGTITMNGTTAVAYNTTSDYRLKENIQPLTGALSRVAALKPCVYTWKSAPDEIGEGFIAHELSEVCPQAVTGVKDAVNEDGSIKPQSIDTSFLVATLTAAIQEQQAIIESLKARLDAANL